MEETQAPWGHRLLAIAAFLGAAPVVWLIPLRRRSDFLERQCAQALVLFLALAMVTFVNAMIVLAASYLLVFQRAMYEAAPVERVMTDIQGTLLLLWLIAWAIGVGKALLGSTGGIPYLIRLRDSRIAVRSGWAVTALALTSAIVVGGIVLHARALADNYLRPAHAYMLYDDIGWVPQWVFELGFYRIARAADAQWGRGSAVVVPFTMDALGTALAHGSFVFLSSHGTEEGLITPSRTFGPEDAAMLPKSPRLQYVYITGCDSGMQARAWEEALTPAQVVTFNRLSAVVEHAVWLWIRGPGVIRGLAASEIPPQ